MCNCKTSSEKAPRPIAPVDQCLKCCEKHLDIACGAYKEAFYEKPNRQWVRQNLQAALYHCNRQWPDLAADIRQLYHLVQGGGEQKEEALSQFEKIYGELDILLENTLDLVYNNQ